MWTWFFQKKQANQPNKNKINAATIEKAMKILEQCETELEPKRKKHELSNQRIRVNTATTNNKTAHKNNISPLK